jgi:PST family polysaccharide transporter
MVSLVQSAVLRLTGHRPNNRSSRSGVPGQLLVPAGLVCLWAALFVYALIPVWLAVEAAAGGAPGAQQDFRDALYFPGRELLRGGNPYDPAAMFAHWPVAQEFDLYLPEHFWLATPLALLSFRAAALLHAVFVAAVVSALGAWAARWAGLNRRWAIGLAAFLLASQTGGAQIFLGQIGALTCLGAAVALHHAGRRPALAAAGLAVAWVKPQYGLPLALLLLVGGYRREALRGTAAAAMASLPVVGLLVVREGPGGFLDSLRRNLLFARQTSYSAVDAMTGRRVDLGAVLDRAFGTSIPGVEIVAAAAVLVVAGWALRSLRSDDDPLDPSRQLIVGLAVVISVAHQPGDALFLFPAMIAALVGLRRATSSRWAALTTVFCLPQFALVYRVASPVEKLLGLRTAGLIEGFGYTLAFAALVVGAHRLIRSRRRAAPTVQPLPSHTPESGPAKGQDELPPERDLRTLAARGAAWLGLVNIVAKGSQVLVTLALARFLSPHELGLVSLTTAVLHFASLLQTMGLFDVVTRTRSDPQRLAGTLVTLGTTIGAVLGTAGFVAAPVLARALHTPDAAGLFRAVSVCLPAMAYAGVQVAITTRTLQYDRRVVAEGGSAVLGAATTVTLAAVGWGARGAVTGLIVAMISGPLLGIAVGIRIRPAWSSEHAREALGWAWVAGPGALIGLAILNVDYLVTARVLGETATGLYSLAYRVAFLPYVTGAMVLSGVAFPVFSQLHRRGKLTELQQSITSVLGVSAAVVMGLYSVVFAVADQIVLLGTKWTDSVVPLQILCIFGIFMSLNLTFLDALRAMGHKGRYFWAQTAHLTVLLGSLITLTMLDGIQGTAWAQAGSACFVTVLATTLTCRIAGLPIRAVIGAVQAPAAATALVVAATLGMLERGRDASLLTALLIAASAALLYTAALWVLDRSLLLRALRLVPGLRGSGATTEQGQPTLPHRPGTELVPEDGATRHD